MSGSPGGRVVSELRVIDAGLLTTVQDLGRWGFQSSGVSVAGPMDRYAHRLANALVGNAAEDATLEVTLVGPELECDDERVIAMTGAEFELTVDERPVPMHTPLALRPRSRAEMRPTASRRARVSGGRPGESTCRRCSGVVRRIWRAAMGGS